MQELLKKIEQSGLDLLVLDATDLPGLAQLHSRFQAIGAEALKFPELPENDRKRLHSASNAAADLVERLILREVDNADHALKVLTDATEALNALARQLNGGDSDLQVRFPAELGLPEDLAGGHAAAQNDSGQPPANVDPAIYREFLAGLGHTLESFEAAVLAAEQEPTDENRAAVQAILHNLKGEAGLMGLDKVAALCHDTETLLAKATKCFPAQKLLKAHDRLSELSAQFTVPPAEQPAAATAPAEKPAPKPAPETQPDDIHIAESDAPLVRDFICESNEHLESVEADLLAIEEKPDDPETLNSVFRAFHTIKGVAGFLNLKAISDLAHCTENLLDLARKQQLSLTGPSIDVVFEAVDAAKKMLADLHAAMESQSAFRPLAGLDALVGRIKACAEGRTESTAAADAPAAADSSTARTDTNAAARKLQADATVKVTTSRLDSLINMVGELVIAQSMVSQGVSEQIKDSPVLDRNVRHLDKITRELQELSMSMRMVPVQGIFQKTARLVRDLSRKAGKQIDLVMTGADTEVDRNVVEAVADPLVHMIRNAVDHGIESPQDRRVAGKDPTGHVELRAYHQGGNIVIEIRDDGRGLNHDRILAKAVTNGLVKPGQELSESEVYRLIFAAGLSTAEKVTDVSGRGVGMDVVKKNVEALRGRVDIESTPGQGSTFFIRLPLTLAVIDGQIVAVGRRRYIVPILSIEQSLRPTRSQLATVQGGRGEIVNIRGSLIPLIRLHDVFHIEPRSTDPTETLIVVVADGPHRCALLVDDLLGQQQVVIKSLGDYLGRVPSISGAAIMGDGHVSLILDVPGLIALARQH
jgi:two-component system chemotaxis sensor kinase CheA